MRVCSFLCSDSLVYTSFFSFLFYTVFIHVIVHGPHTTLRRDNRKKELSEEKIDLLAQESNTNLHHTSRNPQAQEFTK